MCPSYSSKPGIQGQSQGQGQGQGQDSDQDQPVELIEAGLESAK